MSVCALFQEAIREVYAHFETAQMSTNIITSNNSSLVPKTEKNNQNLFYYAQYHSFCELLRDIHLLRDFTLQTYQIIQIMIDRLQKNLQTRMLDVILYDQQIKQIQCRFRNICELPLYTSPILSKLATRTEVIATSLLCARNNCQPQQTAFVLSLYFYA